MQWILEIGISGALHLISTFIVCKHNSTHNSYHVTKLWPMQPALTSVAIKRIQSSNQKEFQNNSDSYLASLTHQKGDYILEKLFYNLSTPALPSGTVALLAVYKAFLTHHHLWIRKHSSSCPLSETGHLRALSGEVLHALGFGVFLCLCWGHKRHIRSMSLGSSQSQWEKTWKNNTSQ